MADVSFKSNVPAVLAAFEAARRQALEAIGQTAEKHAKDITPVDTGRLRNSIAHATQGNAAYIGTNVDYAPYVEFGTHRQKAHHMLKRAATEHGDEYKAIAQAAFEAAR